MITIGLLYSNNDDYSLLRSEMLVGPMLMANVNYVRFKASDIDAKTLRVKGQRYVQSKWVSTKPTKLNSILDLSLPKQKRTKSEKALLANTPHTLRIDLESFELLDFLSQSNEFKYNLPKHNELNNFEDIKEAIAKYQTIVIKKKNDKQTEPILILSQKEDNCWIIDAPYETKEITTSALRKLLIPRYNGNFFIQEFIEAKAYNNRALAFKIVVQERFDGAWISPIIRGVISTDGPIASISVGGEAIGTPLLLKDNSFIKSETRSGIYLHVKLQKLSITIANYIKESFKGSPCALELKLGYDNKLRPYILSINSRASAPSMPGRTIEFYRHLTDHLIALSKSASNKQLKYTLQKNHHKLEKLPLEGSTIKNFIHPDNRQYIFDKPIKWIDLAIGFGGRTTLKEISNLKKKPFLSLRIGNAQNDIIKNVKPPKSLIAIEEFIGRGLIKWKEAEYMRSIRLPLLKDQLEKAQTSLQGLIPDIIFLEDADLGSYSLNSQSLKDELEKTFEWFEKLSQDGLTKAWGITLYNCRSKVSKEILTTIQELSGTKSHCKYLATPLNKLDPITLKVLKESDLISIVIPKNISNEELSQLNKDGIHTLLDWNTENLERIQKLRKEIT